MRLWLAESIGRYLATASDANGNYSFTGIPQGLYQVQFAGTGYAAYWHLNQTVRQNSTIISIGSTAVTVNANLVGLCSGNGTLILASGPSVERSIPLAVSTTGVLLLVVGSYSLLANSKRKALLARGIDRHVSRNRADRLTAGIRTQVRRSLRRLWWSTDR